MKYSNPCAKLFAHEKNPNEYREQLDLICLNDEKTYIFSNQTKVIEELGHENEFERSGSFWKQLNSPKKILVESAAETEVKSYQKNRQIDLLQNKRKVTLGPKIVYVNKLSLLNLLKPAPQCVEQFRIPTYLKFASEKSEVSCVSKI